MKKKAFTLVEVVISSAIMVLSLTALLGSFVMARRAVMISGNRVKAMQDARENMETLLVLPYNMSQLNYGVHSLSKGFYSITTNAAYPSTVKDISVTLVWTNPMSTITSTITLNGSLCTELHY